MACASARNSILHLRGEGWAPHICLSISTEPRQQSLVTIDIFSTPVLSNIIAKEVDRKANLYIPDELKILLDFPTLSTPSEHLAQDGHSSWGCSHFR